MTISERGSPTGAARFRIEFSCPARYRRTALLSVR
jgi:hypothetical protein